MLAASNDRWGGGIQPRTIAGVGYEVGAGEGAGAGAGETGRRKPVAVSPPTPVGDPMVVFNKQLNRFAVQRDTMSVRTIAFTIFFPNIPGFAPGQLSDRFPDYVVPGLTPAIFLTDFSTNPLSVFPDHIPHNFLNFFSQPIFQLSFLPIFTISGPRPLMPPHKTACFYPVLPSRRLATLLFRCRPAINKREPLPVPRPSGRYQNENISPEAGKTILSYTTRCLRHRVCPYKVR